jgi:hypothetical protein
MTDVAFAQILDKVMSMPINVDFGGMFSVEQCLDRLRNEADDAGAVEVALAGLVDHAADGGASVRRAIVEGAFPLVARLQWPQIMAEAPYLYSSMRCLCVNSVAPTLHERSSGASFTYFLCCRWRGTPHYWRYAAARGQCGCGA